MSIRLTVLGSGTSHGIPMIGCDCAVCCSNDPRDRRTRPSVVFSFDDRHVLVDTGPELRLQALAAGLSRVDAVLYTHHHADHIVGLDDLRRFNALARAPLPVYGSAATLRGLRAMFPYAFREDPDYPSSKPNLVPVEIDGEFELFGRRVVPIPLLHGTMPVLGFRIGDVAYCTDCSAIPPESWKLLEGLQVLILDGLRRRPHPTHFNITQAVEVAGRIGARRTYFTHIAHELGHRQTNAELPDGMELAYDGLVIETP